MTIDKANISNKVYLDISLHNSFTLEVQLTMFYCENHKGLC